MHWAESSAPRRSNATSVRCPAVHERDDVLDAFAGAWTARRHAAAQHLQLGGEVDARGLRMEVIA